MGLSLLKPQGAYFQLCYGFPLRILLHLHFSLLKDFTVQTKNIGRQMKHL